MPITPQARRQASQIFDTTHSEGDADDVSDMRSALDRTIDKIGMGPYQWALLGLCGFGWAADNMWMQAVTVILPRVQDEYAVPDSQIGILSTSVFFGMMFGALGWGSCSDVVGRRMAFNLTLAFTGLFGVLACFATSFWGLCFLLFLLGTAVGGSMPTDGTLFLENVPQHKQYLLTALSVFFSLGAVVNAVIAIFVIPGNSCPEVVAVAGRASGASFLQLARAVLVRDDQGKANEGEPKVPPPCDIATQNRGWKYLLAILGTITIIMFVLRIIFFQLYESPRYLVANGRNAEAVAALQSIEDYNMKYARKPTRPRLVISLSDVCDVKPSAMEEEECVLFSAEDEEAAGGSAHRSDSISDENKAQTSDTDKEAGRSRALAQQDVNPTDYHSTETTPDGAVGREWSFDTPATTQGEGNGSYFEGKHTSESQDEGGAPSRSRSRSGSRFSRPRRPQMAPRPRSSIYVEQSLPPTVGRPLSAWLDRVGMLFTRKWWLTTTLVWLIWWGISLAYTMYNVYLPKLLERRLDSSGTGGSRLEALWDMVIFTTASCPGPLLGAWMIESSLGRRKSLALSLVVTMGFCVAFIQVDSKFGVMWSTVGISLATTIVWAVLYGMTPEIFETKVRGTACGIASALNRVGGMIAPIVGGILIESSMALPVYTAIVIFGFVVICVLLMPFEKSPNDDEAEGDDGRGGYSVLH
ncbi:major facilitator superfamily transporter [Ceratobasidium sp. AG-Ba]|nr:major facilitator superfamily transporter [Ceratobasidium sp. AG-Ba]